MIPFSPKYKEKLSKDQRDYRLSVKITPVNGTQFELTNEHLWANTFKIEDATSQGGKFTIGAAVTSKFSVTINNINGDYDDIDFYNAVVVPTIGLNTGDLVEAFVLGYYRVNDAKYNGSTISITCLDRLADFDVSCETMNLVFPATLTQIVNKCCSDCGITADTTTYPPIFASYTVQDKPDLKSTTYADLISMAAQIGCSFAKMDRSGKLSFSWYALGDAIEIIGGYDGGTFKYDGKTYDPNKDEAELDGGTFRYDGKAEDPNKDESNVDGGTFSRGIPGDYRPRSSVHIISGIKSLDVSTDEVQVTGVKVTEEFEEKGPDAGGSEIKKATYTAGDVSSADRYVVDISGNKFIQHHEFSASVMQGQKVANDIYSALRYYPFRPFKASILNDASIEAGDVCVIMDRKNHSYAAFISNRSFTVGQYENISCDAESPMTKAATRYTQLMKALTAAEAEAQARLEQLKVLQESVVAQIEADRQAFNILVANSLGGYQTPDTDPETGATIYYFHDQPQLANSTKVWKMTADTFSATDNYQGAQTDWKMGMDVSGNALLHNLSADWINAGTISADRIGAGSITATKIAANAVTADKINAGAVNADKIAANAVTAGKIAANAVTAEKINAGAVTAGKIAANAVTAEKIDAGAITAGKIASGAITTEKLAADAITGKTISGGTISGAKIESYENSGGSWTNRVIINSGSVSAESATAGVTLKGSDVRFSNTAANRYSEIGDYRTTTTGIDLSGIRLSPGTYSTTNGQKELFVNCAQSFNAKDTSSSSAESRYYNNTPYTGVVNLKTRKYANGGDWTERKLVIIDGLVCKFDGAADDCKRYW